ncbi:MAG: hypothetical protein U0797_01200 [Gemmataceae bacterium]
MGRTDEVMKLGSLSAKLTSFGPDGPGRGQARRGGRRRAAGPAEGRPVAALGGLMAHTVKGKGVVRQEDDNRWHYTRLTARTYATDAMAENAGAVSPYETLSPRPS